MLIQNIQAAVALPQESLLGKQSAWCITVSAIALSQEPLHGDCPAQLYLVALG